jgi:signal transduction histidine kinase
MEKAYVPCEISRVANRQALEHALQDAWAYDLLLISGSLPDQAGLAALSWVRSRWPALPVVMILPPEGPDETLELMRAGAAECVPAANLAPLAPAVRRTLEAARTAAAGRQADAANHRLASILKALLEATREGILVTDLAGKISLYNRKFLALCGIPEYLLAPMEMDQLMPFLVEQFRDPAAFLDETQRLLRQEEGGAASFPLKVDRILEETVRPQRIGAQVVGRLYSFRDVTEREHSVVHLRQQAALAQDLLSAAQAARVVPWAALDAGLAMPAYAAPLLGLRPEELPGDLAGLAGLIHPDDRDRLREALETPEGGSFEARVGREGGEWSLTGWNVGRNAEGKPGGAILDLSGQVRERAHAAQAERVRWQSALTASMARALRPSLEGLEEGLAGMREAGAADPPGQAAFAKARRCLDELAAAVAGMAATGPDVTRMEALLDLNRLVERVRPWAEAVLGPAIRLRLEPAPDLPALPLHPARMEPLLMNLLLNARDAMDGAGEIRVRTGRQPVAGPSRGRPAPVFLEVLDTGSGIAPRVQERMFEPFFTTRPGRMGLGLAVVRSIVDACGGSIRVDTGAMAGTAIRVLLPVD